MNRNRFFFPKICYVQALRIHTLVQVVLCRYDYQWRVFIIYRFIERAWNAAVPPKAWQQIPVNLIETQPSPCSTSNPDSFPHCHVPPYIASLTSAKGYTHTTLIHSNFQSTGTKSKKALRLLSLWSLGLLQSVKYSLQLVIHAPTTFDPWRLQISTSGHPNSPLSLYKPPGPELFLHQTLVLSSEFY